jgi:hypothetical protein
MIMGSKNPEGWLETMSRGLIFGYGVQSINMDFAVIHPEDDIGKIIYNSVHHGFIFKKQIKFAKKQ